MAKIPQGILGGLSGTVGNVVGGAWKGLNYIRTKPLSVANPNTAAQQAQRSKFASCVAVARLLLADLINTYWDPFSRYMSGYNAFIKANISVFDETGLATPSGFKASMGSLTGLELSLEDCNIGGTMLDIAHSVNTGQGDALATDKVAAGYHDTTDDIWGFIALDGDRSNTENLGSCPCAVGNSVDVWAFAYRQDLSKVSDSSYVGTLTVQA